MNELLAQAIAAHGGLDRWKRLNKVSATIVSGGGLLPMKGLEADPTPLLGTATTRTESTVIEPFGQPDWRMIFTPDRVAIETTAGALVNERLDPRCAFAEGPKGGEACAPAFLTDSPAIAKNKISILATIFYSAAMTTTSKWQAEFP